MAAVVENVANQWHLLQTLPGKYDLNVAAVWADYTGKGVSTFVIDDGFDLHHSDLAPHYNTFADFDYLALVDNALGEDWSPHGTAVMGLIGAARNGTGLIGVAYDVSLTGYRVGPSTDAGLVERVAQAIYDAADHGADTVNMSLSYAGFFDDGQDPGQLDWLATAIDHAVDTGRHGLGTIMTKSAGNTRDWGGDSGSLSFNGNTQLVVVAAVDQDGKVSSYSAPGASVLVSGFGSDLDVVTLDRSGVAGWTPGDFTDSFDGTSAASAMVNGVTALVLDANAQLGWRDVQSILAYSARHVGSAVDGHSTAGVESQPWQWNHALDWNGGALHYSRDYGFGLVDARVAVRLAESWQITSTSANETVRHVDVFDGSSMIGTVPTSFTVANGMIIDVERVRVDIDFATTDLGDVDVYLVSPNGTTLTLLSDLGATAGNPRGDGADFDGTWSFEAQGLKGEELSGNGTWTIRLVDDNADGTTEVRSVDITAFGSSNIANDSYIYTNEFSGFSGGRKVLADTDGGSDWLNAAAVTSASVVSLLAGRARIDGVALSVRGVEHVYGGDGGDSLVGNGLANALVGARGNDSLAGCGGTDRLSGGVGGDWLDGGLGSDFLAGGLGRDVLVGGKGRDTFDFNTVADTLRAVAARDVIRDFTRQDRIDLSGIDASSIAAGNQAFRLVQAEGAHFTGARGQLVWDQQNFAGRAHDRTVISGDINGDRIADFAIELSGLKHIIASDFVL